MTKPILLIIWVLFLFASCNKVSTSYEPTAKEKEWIAKHEFTIGVYPLYPPYAFVEEKQSITGLFKELQQVIDDATGFRYKQVFYPTWADYLKAAETGNIDVIHPIIPTTDRRTYLSFTSPVVMDPHVMVVRKDAKKPQSLADLKQHPELRIAAVKDYFITDYLLNTFGQHEIVYYADDRKCIKALNRGEVDVFMSQKYTVRYFLKDNDNLVTISDIPANTILSIGVQKDKSMLYQIYSKAINGISEADLAKLVNKWSYQRYLPFYRQYSFWLYTGLMAAGVALLLLFWNKTLSREVKSRTEQLLEAKLKAEESDRLKTAFVSNISHEVRTPLNAINGYSELLALEFSDPKIQEYSNDILANSHRLTGVIESMIIFSQLESGEVTVSNQKIDLNELMETVVVKFKEMVPDKLSKIDFKTEFASEAYPLQTDPFYFRKMLSLLIENSFKFTEAGEVVMGYKLINNALRVFVKDTGSGIDPVQLPKIFDKFHKFSIHNDRFYSGTGVGLTIVKGLANLLGFVIDVESTPGSGTTFYLDKI